jgi:hypothetical protein
MLETFRRSKEIITEENIQGFRNLKIMVNIIPSFQRALNEGQEEYGKREGVFINDKGEAQFAFDDEIVRMFTAGTLGIFEKLCRDYRKNEQGEVVLMETPKCGKLAHNILEKARNNT